MDEDEILGHDERGLIIQLLKMSENLATISRVIVGGVDYNGVEYPPLKGKDRESALLILKENLDVYDKLAMLATVSPDRVLH